MDLWQGREGRHCDQLMPACPERLGDLVSPGMQGNKSLIAGHRHTSAPASRRPVGTKTHSARLQLQSQEQRRVGGADGALLVSARAQQTPHSPGGLPP